MEWCKEILEQVKFENISNEDEKKKIEQNNCIMIVTIAVR